MALIACPECRRRISEAAESCPNCGYTRTLEEVTRIKEIRKKRSKWIIGFLAFLASFVVIAILVGLYSRKSTPPPTEVSTEYDERPRVLSQVHPKYPAAARRAGREGLVTLEFTVEVDGKPTDIKVAQPIGFGFDEAAIEAVKKWRFTPAKKGGEAVPSRVKLPIRFTFE